MRPIYQIEESAQPQIQNDSHKGLWFERFFDYGPNWSIDDAKKKNFLNTVVQNIFGNTDALESNALRQIEMVEALGGECVVLKTSWNFVTGMGLPHPVENGLSWHPTLGVPYLSGSGVKGLLRGWVEEWMEFSNHGEKLLTLYRWFGSEDKDPSGRANFRKDEANPLHGNKNDTIAGDLIFFDAVPIEPVTLTKDIMTPHMGKWYEKGGEIRNVSNEPEKVPADWHDPIPVPFLAVKKANFLFSIAPSNRLADRSEIKKALDVLVEAIEFLGAGAKTAAGYGRMEKDDKKIVALKMKMQRKREELQKKREELQQLKKLESMTPLDKAIAEILHTNPDKNMKDYVLLLKRLEENYWTDENEKKMVAEKIKKLMVDNKAWKETGDPKKNKDHKRTLAVMQYLK